MSSPDLANDLLVLAREDLEAARSLPQGGRVSERPIGFHAQQAVEKALKAVLAAKGVQFPFSHDIALLVELCKERGCEIPEDFLPRSQGSLSAIFIALAVAATLLAPATAQGAALQEKSLRRPVARPPPRRVLFSRSLSVVSWRAIPCPARLGPFSVFSNRQTNFAF